MRMGTAEEKLDLLVSEVKLLQAGQLDLATKVDAISKWSIDANNFSVELNKSMVDLTSRMEALEAATSAPPKAPPHEEEGRANDHRPLPHHQGDNVRAPDPHHTLVKGESQQLKTTLNVDDSPNISTKKASQTQFQYAPKEYRLPKVDFPRFEGDHPRV